MVDDDVLDRRMRDWKQSESAAREAEKAAAALQPGVDDPVVERAARLRGIAEVKLASILEDMREHRTSFTPFSKAERSRQATVQDNTWRDRGLSKPR